MLASSLRPWLLSIFSMARIPASGRITSAIKAVAMRKVARRLIPLLCVVYVTAFSYRSNISVASLRMSNDLGLKPPMFGLVAEPF